MMKRLVAILKPAALGIACLLFLGVAQPATAGTDEDARKHFEAGESYFKTSDYEGAIREFQTAYKLSKRPLILLNLANVYERMGKLQETIDSLKQYLAEDPKAKDKATIELRIANIQKRLEEQTRAAAAASAAQSAAAVPTTPPPTPSESAPPPPPTASAPPPELPPNRVPAYISWGIGGAALAGAVVTGLIAQGKYNDADSGCHKTAQGCSDSDISPIKSMALVSTICTGVAVVGVGLGTYLFFSAKPRPAESATLRPQVSGGVGPGGGGVSAVWRF